MVRKKLILLIAFLLCTVFFSIPVSAMPSIWDVSTSISSDVTVTLKFTIGDCWVSYNPYYEVNWGDGSSKSTGNHYTNSVVTKTHTYSDLGTYTITIKAWDNIIALGEPAVATTTVTLENTAPPPPDPSGPPTVQPSPAYAQVGESISFTFTSADDQQIEVTWEYYQSGSIQTTVNTYSTTGTPSGFQAYASRTWNYLPNDASEYTFNCKARSYNGEYSQYTYFNVIISVDEVPPPPPVEPEITKFKASDDYFVPGGPIDFTLEVENKGAEGWVHVNIRKQGASLPFFIDDVYLCEYEEAYFYCTTTFNDQNDIVIEAKAEGEPGTTDRATVLLKLGSAEAEIVDFYTVPTGFESGKLIDFYLKVKNVGTAAGTINIEMFNLKYDDYTFYEDNIFLDNDGTVHTFHHRNSFTQMENLQVKVEATHIFLDEEILDETQELTLPVSWDPPPPPDTDDGGGGVYVPYDPGTNYWDGQYSTLDAMDWTYVIVAGIIIIIMLAYVFLKSGKDEEPPIIRQSGPVYRNQRYSVDEFKF